MRGSSPTTSTGPTTRCIWRASQRTQSPTLRGPLDGEAWTLQTLRPGQASVCLLLRVGAGEVLPKSPLRSPERRNRATFDGQSSRERDIEGGSNPQSGASLTGDTPTCRGVGASAGCSVSTI